MLGVALALVALGVVMLFFVPWVGVPVGVVGLILAGVAVFGAGRRATEPRA